MRAPGRREGRHYNRAMTTALAPILSISELREVERAHADGGLMERAGSAAREVHDADAKEGRVGTPEGRVGGTSEGRVFRPGLAAPV